MAKEIITSTTIQASPKTVWTILTDFNTYPAWNPFIKNIKGDASVGYKIDVTIQPPGGGKMRFAPVIQSKTEHRELTWLGRLIMPGIFDGYHRFELIDNGNGTTKFVHSERFRGILVALMDLSKTAKGFELMNMKLKEVCEERERSNRA